MKKTIILITISVFSLFAMAQEKIGTISGIILNVEHKPLESATVQLQKAENKAVVKFAVTNKQGAFEIDKVNTGKYILLVTAIGYTAKKSETIEIGFDKRAVNVSSIELWSSIDCV